MKTLKYMLALGCFAGVLSLASCEEIGPAINFDNVDDTTYVVPAPSAQIKNLLIEESTGVQCPNCPKGAEAIDKAMKDYPGRVVAVAYHWPMPLVAPIDKDGHKSIYDFRPDESFGNNWVTYIGGMQGQPSANFNRVKYGTVNPLMILLNNWNNAIATEMTTTTTPVNVEIVPTFNEALKELSVVARVTFNQDVDASKPLHFSLLITESGMVDVQETPVDFIEDFHFKHVFRTMLTPYNGVNITVPDRKAGRVWEVKYKFSDFRPAANMKYGWNPDSCHVVGFVHEDGSDFDSKKVLQAEEVKMK
jgi:hypothetical protein